MRISDWSSDVCSSDLGQHPQRQGGPQVVEQRQQAPADQGAGRGWGDGFGVGVRHVRKDTVAGEFLVGAGFSRESRLCLRPGKPNTPTLLLRSGRRWRERPEEHTSELQSLMRISYAVF